MKLKLKTLALALVLGTLATPVYADAFCDKMNAYGVIQDQKTVNAYIDAYQYKKAREIAERVYDEHLYFLAHCKDAPAHIRAAAQDLVEYVEFNRPDPEPRDKGKLPEWLPWAAVVLIFFGWLIGKSMEQEEED